MKKDLLKQTGITLVALIITIIILIILAGITLNLALGENGIFNKSKQGANKYMMESVKEELSLIIQDKMLEYVKLEKELTLNELKNPTIKDVESLETKLKKEDKNAVVYEVDEEGKILPVDYKGYEFEIQESLEVKYKGEAEKQISEKEEIEKEIEEELQKMPPEFFTTTETEGIVTITGINNLYKEDNTIKYEGYTGTLVIPSTLKDGNVSTISANAMQNITNINKLYIQEGIATIDASAFYGCSQMNKLIIPDTVTKLGGNAFYQCTGLTNITLPITLNLKDGSTAAGFVNSTGIKEVTLTKGNGGEGVDYNSNTYTGLPWYYSKGNEITIKLEEGITKIGSYMFAGATGIKSINIPKTVESIGDYAFSNCGNWDEEIDISNVSNIGINAFYQCLKIKGNLNFSNKLTSIPKYAFFRCKQINKLVIPDTVTELGVNAFDGCTGLTNITLPITLNLKDGAKGAVFEGCTGIQEVTLTKGNGGEGVDYNSNTNKGLPWYYSKENEITIKLEEGITKIGSYMFAGATGIKSINIPKTVESIGDYAFSNCGNWDEEIDISNVSNIGINAFYQCLKIKGNLNFSNKLTSIPKYAFFRCEQIKSINIPKTIESIEDYAFNGCKGLEEINYDGSNDDWNRITKGTGNDVLTSEKINYSNQ